MTSERLDGQFVHFTHPNLRERATHAASSCAPTALEPCDLLFLCLPHGSAMSRIDHFAALAAADRRSERRLPAARSRPATTRWYGKPHANPAWLEKFVYGLPELHRARALAGANYVSGVGCNATATNLAIWPLAKAGLIDAARGVICEVKVGSSEGGAASSDSTHHPERAGVMRSFAPTGHRHTAEVLQALALAGRGHRGAPERHRRRQRARRAGHGARLRQATAVAERDIWKAYREAYDNEPFVRIVKERTGLYRYPEPKILSGSNYADVGFEFDRRPRAASSRSAPSTT